MEISKWITSKSNFSNTDKGMVHGVFGDNMSQKLRVQVQKSDRPGFVLVLPLPACMTLDKLYNLFRPQALHL